MMRSHLFVHTTVHKLTRISQLAVLKLLYKRVFIYCSHINIMHSLNASP